MKKNLLFVMAAGAMLFATSCQNDLDIMGNVGEETLVSFNVTTPDMATRAYSDGNTATVLQYAVYDAAGNELEDLTVTNGKIEGSASVELQLTTGNTYSVIFWAAAQGAPYEVNFANKTMTVDYTAPVCNDEKRDAFYKYYTFTVKGAQTETIELKRPFAQLNIGTADYAASASAGYTPTLSSVKVSNVYTTLDLVEGNVATPVEVAFAEAVINKGEIFPVNDAVYDYLAMNYLLVAKDKETVNIEFTYTDGANAKTRIVGSVPVQRNYRTNIYGALLTSEVDINVTIEPEYDGEFDNEGYFVETDATGKTVAIVESANGLATIAEQFNTGELPANTNIVLEGDIDLNDLSVATRSTVESNWTPIGTSANPFTGTFDGKGYTIKNLVINGGTNSNIGLFGYTTNGEIKNVTIENAKVSGRLNVGVVAGTPYTSKYTNITVKGHVEVDGMAYVGAVGGKNAYADWTNITVDVDETSYANAYSVENGTAYRSYVGGVVGFNGEGGHKFSNIKSNINVKGSTCDVGGLFGIAHYGNQFENCVCTGNVEIYAAADEADAQEIGGIAGVWHNGGQDVVMTKCKFTGELKANNDYVINTERFGNLVCASYNTTGNGKLIIDGVSYVNAGDGVYVHVGSIVEIGAVKAIVFSVENGVKAVSVEEMNLNGKNFSDATAWAEGLGKGWALASIYELDAIHAVRDALNDALEADNAENALFEEDDYYSDGKYALYLSSTEATGNDPQGVAYFSNRVHVKYFNINGYWDYPYSTFATISKNAPLKENYFARGVYQF